MVNVRNLGQNSHLRIESGSYERKADIRDIRFLIELSPKADINAHSTRGFIKEAKPTAR